MYPYVIKAPMPLPEVFPLSPESIFLAGGISNCPLWQDQVIELFENMNVILINPRRKGDLVMGGDPAKEQIVWEYRALREADHILFWFPAGPSPCPIALYELGYWLLASPYVYVGCDLDYVRKFDLEVQVGLLYPDRQIFHTLESLVQEVIKNIGK